jgi:uncharacterized protein YcfL
MSQMKRLFILILFFLCLVSCSPEQTTPVTQEITINTNDGSVVEGPDLSLTEKNIKLI